MMSCSNTHASSSLALLLSRGSSTINVLALYVRYISRSHPSPSIYQLLYRNRPVVASHVDPADWVLHWWHLYTHPCRAVIHDLAIPTCTCRHLQHFALHRDNRYSRKWWYFPSTLLHHVFVAYFIYSKFQVISPPWTISPFSWLVSS
jgi:hypothetical protein